MVKCPSLSESLTQHKDPAKKNSFNLNRPNDAQQMEDPNGRSFPKSGSGRTLCPETRKQNFASMNFHFGTCPPLENLWQTFASNKVGALGRKGYESRRHHISDQHTSDFTSDFVLHIFENINHQRAGDLCLTTHRKETKS
jgi:hypothetical protein